MFESMREATPTRAHAWWVALFMLGAAALTLPQVMAAEKKLGKDKAYTFAGVVIDGSRRVERDKTIAEVKVVDSLPTGRNAGKSYDLVFVVTPGSVSAGKIFALTSAPVASCRSFLKTFLTKTLSSKRISKAYKGARLATVDKDSTARKMADRLHKDGWLTDCSASPPGELDVFQVLVVNGSDR